LDAGCDERFDTHLSYLDHARVYRRAILTPAKSGEGGRGWCRQKGRVEERKALVMKRCQRRQRWGGPPAS
jgi:hypothetical protein